jgi:hypothetical protein
MRISALAAVFAILATSGSIASSPSPYVGAQSQDIKALSPAETEDLLAGRGMGYAKAAELNGYPGPAHVLELADTLELSARQRLDTQAIFDRMAASARTVGPLLIDAERELDSLFRDRNVNPESLARAVEEIAHLQGELRRIHLQAHIEQTAVLTSSQIAQYAVQRGYTNRSSESADQHHHE